MKTRPYLLHALTPLHAGTGQSVGVIDLPLARARATGMPLVPGSSVKGVLREARSPEDRKDKGGPDLFAVFGPPSGDADLHAGALSVTDARLLALPVRSFLGTFAWVTSPLLLRLARADLGDAAPAGVPKRPAEAVPGDPWAVIGAKTPHRGSHRGKLYLEDVDIRIAGHDPAVDAWAQWLAGLISAAAPDACSERFVVVDDETMTFLYETAMQIDTRVRIDRETGTVAKGALWTEESLPPETVLLGLLVAERTRRKGIDLDADTVLNEALSKEEVLQFGGKATVGRGRCRIVPVGAGS
ncbi:MAG: type III-B CRISPR module RAMP protein Cmr4 [Myxococcales bacterium]|nr:type III-B CRISPR module RAMP protein Cmr4 [Myxococcales bacterium]